MPHEEPLPYWLVNVPQDQWPSECPEFLRTCSDKDKRIIGTRDDEYTRLTWEECKDLVATERIGEFHRVPSELRKYRQFTHRLVKEYGSITNFIINERLQWKTLEPRGRPFEFDEDIKILYNDWPYGIDDKIVHLVIWTKFELEEEPGLDCLKPEAHAAIEAYVQRTFGTKVARDKLVWFKNWTSLKSVHAVEHFHVMLYDPDPDFIKLITNGDAPLASLVA